MRKLKIEKKKKPNAGALGAILGRAANIGRNTDAYNAPIDNNDRNRNLTANDPEERVIHDWWGKKPKSKKKRVVVKGKKADGSKFKSVESRGGKRLKETYKSKDMKSKQISKNGVIKKTVTTKNGTRHVEKERGKKRVVKTKSRI